MAQTADMARTWSFLNSHLRDGEKGHCITCAGFLLRADWTNRELMAATASSARDAFCFANERFLAVMPREAKPMGLVRAFRAARGDRDAFGEARELPRSELVGYELTSEAPLEGTHLSLRFEGEGFQWLTVDTTTGEQLRMLLDSPENSADLDRRLDLYFEGGDL